MRLNKHINEASGKTSILEIVQEMQRKCQPYLKDMADSGLACEMNSGRKEAKDYFIKPVRKGRKSVDTPQFISDLFDKYFKKKFGWMPRSNSVFTYSNVNDTNYYGISYMLFPVGKYRFVWSDDIKDLWNEIQTNPELNAYLSDPKNKHFKLDAENEVYNFVENLYSDKNLEDALESDGEIMLNASHYLAVHRAHYYNDLSDFVEEHNWNKKPTQDDIDRITG